MTEFAKESLPSSNRLAIVLACLSALLALILFLLDHLWEKNPLFIAGGVLLAVVALAIYPIMHFIDSTPARIMRVAEVILVALFFVWQLWPSIGGGSASGTEKTVADSVAAPVDGRHCASITVKSTISTYDHRVNVHFTYSTNYNQTALKEGFSTPPLTLAPHSYIEQYIDGLSENTTYYYKLVVDGQLKETAVKSFRTEPCEYYQTD